MEYRSKYKAEEIEAILDAKNNTGEGVDSNLDGLFVGQLQTKEVEVSEDTTIKADEGFLGLKEVSVKVSGGGGNGGGGSASSVEYLDLSGVDNSTKTMLITFATSIRAEDSDGLKIITGSQAQAMQISTNVVKAIGVMLNQKIYIEASGQPIMSLKEYFSMALGDSFASIPRITESEFYTL